ncbi:hypothetical protein FRC12_023616 [Ceratobasidium sp. 428]|nr:hypothetical protein FRC12_023616 [Ceratobasidium sp. 428]
MSGSALLSAVYGYEVTSYDDELVKVVESAVNKISEAALAGNFYVNTIPWLKFVPSWLPGAAWKRTAIAWRKEIDRMVNVPYDWTKQQIAAGIAAPSVASQILDRLWNRSICLVTLRARDYPNVLFSLNPFKIPSTNPIQLGIPC